MLLKKFFSFSLFFKIMALGKKGVILVEHFLRGIMTVLAVALITMVMLTVT